MPCAFLEFFKVFLVSEESTRVWNCTISSVASCHAFQMVTVWLSPGPQDPHTPHAYPGVLGVDERAHHRMACGILRGTHGIRRYNRGVWEKPPALGGAGAANGRGEVRRNQVHRWAFFLPSVYHSELSVWFSHLHTFTIPHSKKHTCPQTHCLSPSS